MSLNVQYSKKFEKQFKKLTPKVKDQFISRQDLLFADLHHPQLRVHPLNGKYQGYYSLDVNGDVRALFEKRGTTLIIFGFIGTHSQLYG